MSFDILRKSNEARHLEWAGGESLPLSFRGVELGGEAGEACNEIKKIERIRLGLVGGKEDLGALADELADVIICADLIAMDLGIDLGEAVAKKFNRTSTKYGLESMYQSE
ncbi:MAG: MazG-like family protein [Pirellulaceae bacterium]|nr:nucleotide pyrophosphohydrolase [Planctomycetaceae bacterium]MDG1809410.1 MazG-like family protein [Pirellulaceae bacterium]